MKKILLISSITAAMLLLSACGDSDSSGGDSNTSSSVSSSSSSDTSGPVRKYADLIGTEYPLNAFNMPLANVEFANGYELNATFSVGSGAYHYAGDAENVVYFVSDRGPVITCEESASVTGTEICASGEVFPVNDFTPSIIKAEISADKVKILDIIDLKNVNGDAITGTSPALTNYDIKAFNQDGSEMTPDLDGINPGALVVTKDGFYIADEYGPSILNVDSEGVIVERIVPESMVEEFKNSGYEKIVDGIANVYKDRAPNRGITAMVSDAEANRLFFMLESPINNPDSTLSDNIRLSVYDLKQGSSKKFWYKLASKDAVVSEITFVKDNIILVSEKTATSTKLYKVDISSEIEMYDEFSNPNQSPTFESIAGNTYKVDSILPDSRPDMKAVTKTEVFDTTSDTTAPSSVDGLANLGSGKYVLINNTDSTNGDSTTLTTVSITVE